MHVVSMLIAISASPVRSERLAMGDRGIRGGRGLLGKLLSNYIYIYIERGRERERERDRYR